MARYETHGPISTSTVYTDVLTKSYTVAQAASAVGASGLPAGSFFGSFTCTSYINGNNVATVARTYPEP